MARGQVAGTDGDQRHRGPITARREGQDRGQDQAPANRGAPGRQGTPEAISVYDTEPLKATLIELVDFDLLNSGLVRMSIGAVQVLTGNMQYFDSLTDDRSGACHGERRAPSRLPSHRDRR